LLHGVASVDAHRVGDVLPPFAVGVSMVRRSIGRLYDRFSGHEFYPKAAEVKKPLCPSATCSKSSLVIRYGFYTTKSGKRRRYRCSTCGRTFGSTTNTAYYRLQHRRTTFDEVAALSVEGVSKSAIARVKRIGWNTVNRWLERAAAYCKQFNDSTITELEIPELQADEIRMFAGGKGNVVWIFASLDVSSRLWPSTVIGRRSYRNTHRLFKDTLRRMRHRSVPLIVTDGFEYYAKVVRRLFGLSCLYGQVLKTRRNDRVIRVERRRVVGPDWRFGEALVASGDSSTLNTSFIERLNLTIRQGTSYLTRRSACHARSQRALEDQVEVLRFHYNFSRPHRALKFGREMRTPAMQAGLTSRKLSFRDVFRSPVARLSSMSALAEQKPFGLAVLDRRRVVHSLAA
jgi:transposase-like protein/IS1 family transposase